VVLYTLLGRPVKPLKELLVLPPMLKYKQHRSLPKKHDFDQ
jgi:hypothetical protein